MSKKAKLTKNNVKKLKLKNKNLISILCLAISIIIIYFGINEFVVTQDYVVVHFIDVGQGDATLIQASGGTVLIDGGDNHFSDNLLEYLKNEGVSHITYVVATHPHSDHIGGLINVLYELDVDYVMMPRVAHSTLTFERFITAIENNKIEVLEPIVSEVFNIGNVEFTVLAPNSSGYRSLNDYSIVLRMVYGDVSFLFTGDAERVSENEILKNNLNVSADILQVGHHGSNTSTTQEFLDAVSPYIAVISVGENNSYGHPHYNVINRLNNSNVAIYRTDIHGTIIITTCGNSITVH